MYKRQALICSNMKNSSTTTNPSEPNLESSQIFGSNAIESHLRSEEKRQRLKNTEEPLLTELNSNKIKEILGR